MMRRFSERRAKPSLLKLINMIQPRLKQDRSENLMSIIYFVPEKIPMTIPWNFDTSGVYSVPVITVDNKYKYEKCVNSCDDDEVYKCVHGCPATITLGTKYETKNGWETLTKYIYNVTSLDCHSCLGHINQFQTLNSMLGSFKL